MQLLELQRYFTVSLRTQKSEIRCCLSKTILKTDPFENVIQLKPKSCTSKINVMPVKIRLQRHGKKGKPFYWIVAADARAKRDGKFLEKLGTYNPNTNPAQIDLDVDGSVKWLQNGAQPTDTARTILSYKGVMMKNHLAGGVRKGALTEEQAEAKFTTWLEEKAKGINAKKASLADAKGKAKAEALAAEKAVNEARIAANAPVVEEEKAAVEVDAPAADATKEEE